MLEPRFEAFVVWQDDRLVGRKLEYVTFIGGDPVDRDLGAAIDEEFFVVARHPAVERCLDHSIRARTFGSYQAWGNDDDKFGLLFLER
ncbi:MAG: hypothetical protein ACR2OY_04935 [Boseongicola sp.]